MVELTKKPFYLDKYQIEWVESTISKMSVQEKLQQLFFEMTKSADVSYLENAVKTQKFGGVRYNPMPAAVVQKHNRVLQEKSDIPLLIACNTEAGGNGAAIGGTEIGQQVKIGATNDARYAYELGRVSGIESAAVGCNCCFAPIVDINRNWRNPIVSVRSFGSDADLVLKMSKEYMRGFNESGGVCIMKHFPGDGVDERDQHLSSSVNSLSFEEWNGTFGKVYRGMIDAGVHGVMAGHIMFPAYTNSRGAKMLPATLSKELITDLLRGELGFNGLVVTDASHMVGLTGAMKRSELLPTAIAVGCDMFLFSNDYDEDLQYLESGYERGIITDERLNDALRRILGLKACLHLHSKAKNEIVPSEKQLEAVGCADFQRIAAEVSDRAITLVKNLDGVLPISPDKHRRVLLVPQQSENPFAMYMPKRVTPFEQIRDLLVKEGFEVAIYESLMEQAKKLPPQEAAAKIMNVYGNKTPVKNITDNYDVIIQVAHVIDHGTVQRINWALSKGTPDIPWYVHEVPTIFVSLFCPFHLADVPQVKTYINCYDKNLNTLSALVDKLVGRSDFNGISPVDAFCGLPDTKI